MKFKTDDIVAISSGEYSDFGYHGIFKAAKDFSAKETLAEYQEQVTKLDEGKYHYRSLGDYVAFLAKEGYIIDVDHKVFFIGAYNLDDESGDFDD